MVDGDRLVVWSWLPHGSAGSKLDLVTVVFLIFLGECKRALVAHPGSLGVGKASSEYGFHDVHAAGDLSVFSSTIDYVTVLRLFPGLYVDMPWTTPMYAHIYWLSVSWSPRGRIHRFRYYYFDLYLVILKMQCLVFLEMPFCRPYLRLFTGVELLNLGPFKSFVRPTHRGWRLHPALYCFVYEGIRYIGGLQVAGG